MWIVGKQQTYSVSIQFVSELIATGIVNKHTNTSDSIWQEVNQKRIKAYNSHDESPDVLASKGFEYWLHDSSMSLHGRRNQAALFVTMEGRVDINMRLLTKKSVYVLDQTQIHVSNQKILSNMTDKP